jgi:hypothetical protein
MGYKIAKEKNHLKNFIWSIRRDARDRMNMKFILGWKDK